MPESTPTMSASSPPVRLRAVPSSGPAAVASRSPGLAATLQAGIDGAGLDLASLLQDAVLCRPRGAPEVELETTTVHLRLQGRAAEAWLASWLQAWFRWVDAWACGPVRARLSVTGDPARARLLLEFSPRARNDDRPGTGATPLESAPCWRTFMPLGAALHEVHPAAHGLRVRATGTRTSQCLHRVHIDLGRCLAERGGRADLGANDA